MSIWKRLFGSRLTSGNLDLEPNPNLSDEQILHEYFSVKPEMKRSLRDFVQMICKGLSEKETKRLTSSVTRALSPGISATEALSEGLTGEGGQRRGNWVAIVIDWKAVEEVSWQANELLHVLNIPDEWSNPTPSGSGAAITHLHAFGVWLSARSHQLLHIDTEGDSYMAVALPDGSLQQAIELASSAGIKVRCNASFLSEET